MIFEPHKYTILTSALLRRVWLWMVSFASTFFARVATMSATRLQMRPPMSFLNQRTARSVRGFANASVLVAATLVSGSIAHAVQSIRITRINGVDVPPDEVFVPDPPNDFFDIEWEAVDTDCNHGVNNMITNVDSVGQTSSGGSGFSGSVNLDQGAFPLGCRHSIQIVANFQRPGSCLTLTTSMTSAPQSFWSSPYKDCIGPPKCQEGAGQVGQPCDVATGKMYHEMTDLTIQAALPIKFVRRYDSQSTVNGSLGYGWRHSYAMRVAGSGANREVFTDAQGRQVYFNRLSAGVWDDNRIEKLSLIQGSPPWRVTDKHQTEFDFDSSGNLTTITDRNGNIVTLGYTGSDLTSIADSFGRTVTLAYSGGKLQSISAGSRTVTYSYTNDNLTRVDFPDGSFVTYEYNDPNEPPPKHNLTVARDSATPTPHVIESHTYYANDKVQTTQSDGGNHAYTLEYDTPAAGQTRVTNSRGFQTVYTHDGFSGLVRQSNGPGCTSCGGGNTTTTLDYDNFLNVKDRTDGRGVVTHMTYDGKGNVLTRTEAMGTLRQRTWTHQYHPTFSLPTTTSIPTVGTGSCASSNPNKVVTNTYDSAGNLCNQQISGCNGAIPFCYETFHEYDSHGQTKKRYNPRDCVGTPSCTIPATPPPVTSYDYYADGDPDASKRARLQRVTNAVGHQTNYASNDGSRPPYDLFGNVRSVIDANNVETQYEYDGKNRVTEVRIRGGMATDDIVTENQYDTVGNLDFVRLPNCVETGVGCPFSLDYAYDTVNRLKEVHDPFGNKIVYSYDLEGNRTREEFQDSGASVRRFTNFAYDNFNRLRYVYFTNPMTPPGTIYHEYTYFDDGTRQSERDPEAHVTTFAYDELKRLASITQTASPSLVTTYHYDRPEQESPTSIREPNSTGMGSFETTYTNSDMGWRLSVTSPDTGGTSYEYDPAGNLLMSTDAIPVTVTRTYDALNRLSAVSYPNSALNVTHTYDSPSVSFGKGQRTGMTDPSGTSVYHYDRRGLLATELKTIGLTTYTTGYDHDKSGNLKQLRYPTESPFLRQGQVDYAYDAADRVSLVTTTLNGTTTPIVDTFSYLPFGPRTGMRFPSKLADVRSYGTRYQLTTWLLGSVVNFTHSYDNDLNLTSRTEIVTDGVNRVFEYDEVHRLTQASGPWGSGTACTDDVTYTYDRNGNRLCKGEDATPTSYLYVPGKNRLASETTSGTTTTYAYDNNGNATGVTVTPPGTTRSFQYNHANRLATVDSGATATYTYDGDGRRAKKTSGSITTNYFYDQSGRLLTEMVPGSATTGIDYLYLLGDPLARVQWAVTETALTGTPGPLLVNKAAPNVHLDWTNATGSGNSYVVRRKQVVNPNDKTFDGSAVIAGTVDPVRTYDDPVLNDANNYLYKVLRKTSSNTTHFYHTDHLGSPIAMTAGNGAPVWSLESRPFGDGTPVGVVVSNLRFPGQYFDSETGLHQNWRRDYIPASGRFLEPDPLGKDGETNPYLYALANPINVADPTGEKSRVCCTPVSAALSFLYHCFIESVPNDASGPSRTFALHAVRSYTAGCTYSNDPFDVLAIGGPRISCGEWRDNCDTDRCVEAQHASYPSPTYYYALSTNSNTYAHTVASACGLPRPPIVGPWHTPGWNAPPAQARLGITCPPVR